MRKMECKSRRAKDEEPFCENILLHEIMERIDIGRKSREIKAGIDHARKDAFERKDKVHS